ncbi:hypothetical protein LJR143_003904 [Pseudoxanthomonas sp. LjRoot143]|uniref:hypothetical protein n=1 Tax=Pseudoxanthomonas sp. LjRoot143 TaxID=3342266 RepID=UPI003ECC87BF
MKRLLILCCSILCQPALAITCIDPPLAEQVSNARIVFVATVVSARSRASFGTLQSGDEYRVEYSYEVRRTLKGDPALVTSLFTNNLYRAHDTDVEVNFRDETRLLPGDSVLVVANGAGPAHIAVCAPSRRWEPSMLELLGAGLSSIVRPERSSLAGRPIHAFIANPGSRSFRND